MRISTSGIGIIIQKNSGVFYTNQTGGYACHQPALEGAFIPLFSKGEFYDKLSKKLDDYFFGDSGPYRGHCYIYEGKGINEQDADWLDLLFKESEVPFKVDRDKLNESEEAWIWIEVFGDMGNLFAEGIDGKEGVFVWDNSD